MVKSLSESSPSRGISGHVCPHLSYWKKCSLMLITLAVFKSTDLPFSGAHVFLKYRTAWLAVLSAASRPFDFLVCTSVVLFSALMTSLMIRPDHYRFPDPLPATFDSFNRSKRPSHHPARIGAGGSASPLSIDFANKIKHNTHTAAPHPNGTFIPKPTHVHVWTLKQVQKIQTE